ncbi:hypothetical protein TNCV_4157241 [Trichonephila clavipes]|nr:hypothetical protein TNCV_4157241 [Trichonephila clavipes]
MSQEKRECQTHRYNDRVRRNSKKLSSIYNTSVAVSEQRSFYTILLIDSTAGGNGFRELHSRECQLTICKRTQSVPALDCLLLQ